MALRSTFTVASGQVITSAWGNSVRDHVVTRGAADDVSAEGFLSVNTTTDRLMVHNGTAAVRLANYTANGRTIFAGSGTLASGAALSGVTQQLPISSITSDADGFYTGFDGAHYQIKVPFGLPGVYAFMAAIQYSAGWTGVDSDHIAVGTDAYGSFVSRISAYRGNGVVSVAPVVMNASNYFWIEVRQTSGGTPSATYYAQCVRLCL